jgi:hypothetical protein
MPLTVTTQTRSLSLADEIEQIRHRLRPAHQSEIDKALFILSSSLPMNSTGEEVKMKFEAYHMALKGFCFEAVESAVMDVLQGKAGIDERFCPTPPQLATICRRHQTKVATDMDKLQNRQRQFNARGEAEVSSDARARMAAKCDALVAELAETTEMQRHARATPYKAPTPRRQVQPADLQKADDFATAISVALGRLQEKQQP